MSETNVDYVALIGKELESGRDARTAIDHIRRYVHAGGVPSRIADAVITELIKLRTRVAELEAAAPAEADNREMDADVELARSIHRCIRAVHDGECPSCGVLHDSRDMRTGMGWRCPSCSFEFSEAEAKAGLDLFRPYMRKNFIVFKDWLQRLRELVTDEAVTAADQKRAIAAAMPTAEKPIAGLWRKDPKTPEGKYLVQRRDGTVVEWPNFVLGARDPAAPAALLAYAAEAKRLGMPEQYVEDVRGLATEFRLYAEDHGKGDPGRGRHRIDDPATVEKMRRGGSA